MPKESPRSRFCQLVLGSELFLDQRNSAVISVPMRYEDISGDVLLAAKEAIYSYTPEYFRQMLPFVLHSLEVAQTALLTTGYFDSFFFCANYDFHMPIGFADSLIVDGQVTAMPRYSFEYRQNWIALSVSAMNRFEHEWAYDWIGDLLQNSSSDVTLKFHEDLTMLSRILGMALCKHEAETPAFRI